MLFLLLSSKLRRTQLLRELHAHNKLYYLVIRQIPHSSCSIAHIDIHLFRSVNPLRRSVIHIKNHRNTQKLKVKGVYEKL